MTTEATQPCTCTFRTVSYVQGLGSFWLADWAWFVAAATAAWGQVWMFGAPFANEEIKNLFSIWTVRATSF